MAMMSASNLGGIANLGAIIGDDAVAVIDTGGSLIEAKIFFQTRSEKRQRNLSAMSLIRTLIPIMSLAMELFAFQASPLLVTKTSPRSSCARRILSLRVSGNNGINSGGVEIIPPTLTVADQATLDLGHRQLQLVAWKTST